MANTFIALLIKGRPFIFSYKLPYCVELGYRDPEYLSNSVYYIHPLRSILLVGVDKLKTAVRDYYFLFLGNSLVNGLTNGESFNRVFAEGFPGSALISFSLSGPAFSRNSCIYSSADLWGSCFLQEIRDIILLTRKHTTVLFNYQGEQAPLMPAGFPHSF